MEEIYEKRRNISTFAMKRYKTKELIRLLEDDGGSRSRGLPETIASSSIRSREAE